VSRGDEQESERENGELLHGGCGRSLALRHATNQLRSIPRPALEKARTDSKFDRRSAPAYHSILVSKAHHRLFILWLSVASLAWALPLQACSIPVFRYALERWPSDPYRAIVFHRGPMSEAQRAELKDLTEDGRAGQVHANLAVQTVDLDQKPNPDLRELWEQSKGATLPWMVVRHLNAAKVPGTLWSGPLEQAGIKQVLDSPARKEIVRRLSQGESVVWTLLEIGDAQRDDAAAKLIESRLAYLATVLKLPTLDRQDLANDTAEDQLRLSFSVVRISRRDSAEQAFVRMLLGSEPDLAEIAEPLAFPVFGRGRVLYALAGKGINAEHIDEASSFLIGSCSCEVKEQNPGVDLLISADWEQLIRPTLSPNVETPARASLPGAGASAISDLTSLGPRDAGPNNGAAVEVVSFRPAEKAEPRRTIPTNPFIIGGVALGALGTAAFFLRRRT
jgi:hypothetical protein